MERKTAFFVTGLSKIIGVHEFFEYRKPIVECQEVQGFYWSLEAARRAVLHNTYGLDDCLFWYMVIEEVEEAVYPELLREWWFVWRVDKDKVDYGYWEETNIPASITPKNFYCFCPTTAKSYEERYPCIEVIQWFAGLPKKTQDLYLYTLVDGRVVYGTYVEENYGYFKDPNGAMLSASDIVAWAVPPKGWIPPKLSE